MKQLNGVLVMVDGDLGVIQMREHPFGIIQMLTNRKVSAGFLFIRYTAFRFATKHDANHLRVSSDGYKFFEDLCCE